MIDDINDELDLDYIEAEYNKINANTNFVLTKQSMECNSKTNL